MMPTTNARHAVLSLVAGNANLIRGAGSLEDSGDPPACEKAQST